MVTTTQQEQKATGEYTTMVMRVQSEAARGESVGVDVIIHNNSDMRTYVAPAGSKGLSFSPPYAFVEPSGSCHFHGSFIMPPNSASIAISSFFQSRQKWIEDAKIFASVTLAAQPVKERPMEATTPARPVTQPIGTPPRVLTMEEYERDWKPRGWELLAIGPTATWRKEEWGEWEAIRDLVQNALDETERYTWGYDARGLWIADRGAGVSVRAFLLGAAKVKPEWARGRFGEGMKLALLTFLRLDYSIQALTVGRELWAVFIRVKTGPNEYAEQLHALWRVNGSRVGTTFHIIGYTGPSYENRFAVNLPRSLILTETPSPITEPKVRYNQLIAAERQAASGIGGVVYARDIYMRDIGSLFSYNLWGFDMAPDRHGPKRESDMWVDMGRLWCGVSNPLLLEKFLWMVTDPPREPAEETRNINMNSTAMGSEPVTNKLYIDLITDHAGVWRTAWSRVAGPDAVIRTDSRWDGMVKHLGYRSVSIHWGVQSALSGAIMTDRALVQECEDRLRETKIVPESQMTATALAHLKLARAIAVPFGVKSVQGAVIPPASDEVKRTAGFYDHVMEEIVLHLETLESARHTIDAMVHELGHHRAYKDKGDIKLAEDLQPAHSDAMTRVAAKVVEYTAARRFDEELKVVTW